MSAQLPVWQRRFNVDPNRAAELTRRLVAQGAFEEALQALEDMQAALEVDTLSFDLDDRQRILVTCPFDPPLIERLRRVPGAQRDKQAGLWLLPPRGMISLVELLWDLSLPLCAQRGCQLGGARPPSQRHQEAHRSFCGGIRSTEG